MFELSLQLAVSFFVITGLLFFFGLWMFYDRRDKRYYDAQRHRRSFHCVRCGKLYSSLQRSETVPCPECGFGNGSLKF